MKGICSIILLISTITSFGGDENNRAVIWYHGSTFYKALDKRKDATLYFSEWDKSISQFLHDDDYKTALQLTQKLDPIPDDHVELPDITWLSSVRDKSLVREYFAFLENYGRTAGFEYLVLPDTNSMSSLEKEVIMAAEQASSYYFISRTRISGDLPQSKKEAIEAGPIIWVAEQSSNVRKVSKWSGKYSKDYYVSFQEAGETQSQFFPQTRDLPPELRERLFGHSVVAIDPNRELPIQSEAIIYLGSDENLKSTLSRYVRVYDKPQSEDFPVILDKRQGYEGKIFGNEIIIDFQKGGNNKATNLLVPGKLEYDEIIIAKMLFGAQEIIGKSETEGNRQVSERGYVGHSLPVFEGLDEKYLTDIDQYVEEAIKKYATPGSQLTVLKNGSVVFNKSYGFFTYDSLRSLENHHVFDLASLTKVVATLPAIALLVDQGKISLEDSIGMHLPEFADSNKSGITIKELLAHNGGVRSYIPFWRRAMTGDRLDAFYYKTKEDEERDIRSYGLEPHPALKDSLKNWIRASDLIKNRQKYNYSDLGYMVLHLLVESVSEMPLDEFMNQNFYHPMNLSLTFNPRNHGFTLEDIVPTEYDDRYRKNQVWGEVHDRNAYVFGGVAGHAGLFSNATDLAKMMYMLSNGGYYNGRQYISKETLDTFNFRHFRRNRRGLGWDKKSRRNDVPSRLASDSSFGHTGFTGTMVWSDPEEDLIYVFLSNRIYPDSNNSRLMDLNTRTEIHDVIYESILND